MKRELKSLFWTVRMRPSVREMLKQLAIEHDRTEADTVERLIIHAAKIKVEVMTGDSNER